MADEKDKAIIQSILGGGGIPYGGVGGDPGAPAQDLLPGETMEQWLARQAEQEKKIRRATIESAAGGVGWGKLAPIGSALGLISDDPEQTAGQSAALLAAQKLVPGAKVAAMKPLQRFLTALGIGEGTNLAGRAAARASEEVGNFFSPRAPGEKPKHELLPDATLGGAAEVGLAGLPAFFHSPAASREKALVLKATDKAQGVAKEAGAVVPLDPTRVNPAEIASDIAAREKLTSRVELLKGKTPNPEAEEEALKTAYAKAAEKSKEAKTKLTSQQAESTVPVQQNLQSLDVEKAQLRKQIAESGEDADANDVELMRSRIRDIDVELARTRREPTIMGLETKSTQTGKPMEYPSSDRTLYGAQQEAYAASQAEADAKASLDKVQEHWAAIPNVEKLNYARIHGLDTKSPSAFVNSMWRNTLSGTAPSKSPTEVLDNLQWLEGQLRANGTRNAREQVRQLFLKDFFSASTDTSGWPYKFAETLERVAPGAPDTRKQLFSWLLAPKPGPGLSAQAAMTKGDRLADDFLGVAEALKEAAQNKTSFKFSGTYALKDYLIFDMAKGAMGVAPAAVTAVGFGMVKSVLAKSLWTKAIEDPTTAKQFIEQVNKVGLEKTLARNKIMRQFFDSLPGIVQSTRDFQNSKLFDANGQRQDPNAPPPTPNLGLSKEDWDELIEGKKP